MIYLVIALSVLCCHWLSTNADSEKVKRALWLISCVLVLLIIGLRSYRTGSDTIQYINMFERLKKLSYAEISELEFRDIGFFYLVKTCSFVITKKTPFLIAMAFLSLIGVYDVIYRNCKEPILALFFFITIGNFLFLFTGIRQAIAMSMCMLSVRFIEKRKIVPFVILVLLGSLSHHSALIFLPSYFLARKTITGKTIVVTVAVTVVGYLFFDRLLDFANDLLNYDYGIEETDSGLIFYLVLLSILTYAFFTRNRWATNENSVRILNLGIICAVIWTFRLIGRTAERPSMYWLNFIPIILANACCQTEHQESDNNRRMVEMVRLAAICLCAILFWRRYASLDYAFFWV